MLIFSNSFVCAGGPVVIITVMLCFVPYFYYSDNWKDAISTDPIINGLQSQSYRYSLVAVVAASMPPLMELAADIIISRGKSSIRTLLTFSILFCLIFPELISLNFVSPQSNAKLFLCIRSARLIVYLFLGSVILCQCSQKFWRTKWCTFAVTCIYIGTLILIFPPYFADNIKLWIQDLGAFLQLIGSGTFIYLSYKFLNTKLPDDRNNDHVIADDLLCRFASLFIVIVIFGMFILYFAAGLPYWTEFNGIYLTFNSIILSVPNIGMCVGFSHATRNEAYFMQSVRQKFVRYISHEMRTPLNTAVMGLQYLRSELVKSSRGTDLPGIVDEVKEACEISVSILNEMLDYDKLQSGGMKIEKEEICVKTFLESTMFPFYAQANHKGIHLQCDSQDSQQLKYLFIEIDHHKFAQVIRNLISNALKFTPAGGTVKVITTVSDFQPTMTASKTTTTTTTIPSTKKGAAMLLQIAVIDSGVGVSKGNQDRLFKEIVQFNPNKLQSGGGSGLGLYISKGIMDLHEGDLTISSEGEGFGCTFTVTLQARYRKGLASSDIGECKETSKNRPKSNRYKLPFQHLPSSLLNLSQVMPRTSYSFHTKVAPPNIRSSSVVSAKREVMYDECRSYSDVVDPLPPLLLGGIGTTSSAVVAPEPLLSMAPSPSSLYNILIVDDSTSNRKMLMRLLKDKCNVIHEAIDGREAVNKVRNSLDANRPTTTTLYASSTASTSTITSPGAECKYDAILMDFIMPNMEGPEAAQYMRGLGYTGLIIGITGNVLPADRDKFQNLGANLVLTKPVNIQEIDNAFRLFFNNNENI